jgi:hypothetical protein
MSELGLSPCGLAEIQAQQMLLELAPAPKAERTGALRAYFPTNPVSVQEALGSEKRARRQDDAVLALFRAYGSARRFTPSQVHDMLCHEEGRDKPLLTSIRRSLSTLTSRGLLKHYKSDLVDGPRGARESRWGLA